MYSSAIIDPVHPPCRYSYLLLSIIFCTSIQPTSPFVAAGWSGKQEENVRPAQWLGLLKIHAAWGAEWFYAGFFSTSAAVDSHHHFQDSRGWCWQGMMPSYAQALTTQWAEFLYDGELVMADENTTFAAESTGRWCGQPPYYIKCAKIGESPLLWAGKPNVLAIARRLKSATQEDTPGAAMQESRVGYMYLITLAVQRLSNGIKNAHPAVKVQLQIPGLVLNTESGDGYVSNSENYGDVDGNVDGDVDGNGAGKSGAPGLGLEARLQGSVYVWRNDTSNGTVVYQLDTWHESSHPLYWPQNTADAEMEIEAEMFEGHLGEDGLAAKCLVTELHPRAKHHADFVSSTTYVNLRHTGTKGVCYTLPDLPPRGVLVRSVRLRVRGGSVSVNGRLALGGESSGVQWTWRLLPEWAIRRRGTGFGFCMSGTGNVDSISISAR
jgi:hypothetical protein